MSAVPAPSPALPLTATVPQRIFALVAALACLALIIVCASVSPDPRGHSTHEQFGWAPCPILAQTGRPCFTCGMTTAFSNAAHGRFLASVTGQPMGFLMVLGTSVGFWGALHVALFGSRIGVITSRLLRPRYLWAAAGLWAASWVYTLLTWPSHALPSP